jgi:four helix bundle protein
VPTNIAEGAKRTGRQDYTRFLNIAQGSLAETEYLIMLSRDLANLAPENAKSSLSEDHEIAGILHALRKKVESSDA